MPAVTVTDIKDLEQLPARAADARSRPVEKITTAPSGLEGDGFPVKRSFAGHSHAELDPFVHLDQMGPIEYPPGQAKGTSWHPHRGFETVTYMMDGRMAHRDTAGGGGLIADGATQWMTAGSGLLHIERPPADDVAKGGRFHGVQLWVNLPSHQKFESPRYQAVEANEVLLLGSPDGQALVRVIAGDVAGHKGPGSTHTPIAMLHVTIEPGGSVSLPWDPEFNALVYALEGVGAVGADHQTFHAGQLARFGAGDVIDLDGPPESASMPLELLVLGGRPIGEPVVQYGPFVMNTEEEIAQAFADYQSGKMGRIPPD
jgi:redox-sensitive bicupin YhaK (pirin superfamily)